MDLDAQDRKSPQQVLFNNALTLAIIAFIALFGVNAFFCSKQDKLARKKIAVIDDELGKQKYIIDSLRTTQENRIQDSLIQYPAYQYVTENRETVDSLRNTNAQMLQRAYNIAKSNSMVKIPHKNESVFTDFTEISTIQNIKNSYYKNKRKIREFDRHIQALGTLPQDVRYHIDSATIAQISKHQNQIDSLLCVKDALISGKCK